MTNRGGRAEAPLIRDGAGGVGLRPVDWATALDWVAEKVEALGGSGGSAVVSPDASNENLFYVRRLLDRLGVAGAAFRVPQGETAALPTVPTLKLRADRAANVAGAGFFGGRRADALPNGSTGGGPAGGALVVLDDELEGADDDFGGSAGFFLYLGTRLPGAARNADAVLPIATFAEMDGTFTNFEGRLGRLEPAIPPVGEARPDWEIVARIAAALGADFGWRSHEPISDELATLSMPPSIPGSGRAVSVNGADLPTVDDNRLVLATEQHLYTAGVAGRHAPSLTVMLPDAVAELNPDDAQRLQIAHGDRVHVSSAGGEVNLKAMVARRVPAGVVSLPDRFLEAAPRQLDARAPDGTAVRVSKA